MDRIETIAIAQGGGPTAVINDQLAGALYEAQLYGKKIRGIRNGLAGLLSPAINGGSMDADGERLQSNYFNLSKENSESYRYRPGAELGTTRMKLCIGEDDDKIGIIKDHMNGLGIDALIYFGGNDSSNALMQLGNGIKVVHGAKTIDNDLPMSHHTPGFGSAALFNARAVRSLSLDLFSYQSSIGMSFDVMPLVIYQVMGRETGWLALSTAFARLSQDGRYEPDLPPDIIWPSELEFNDDSYLNEVQRCLNEKGRAFVVVSEGLYKTIGDKKVSLAQLSGKVTKDPNGNKEYNGFCRGSALEYVARISEKRIAVHKNQKLKIYPVNPGYLQRSIMRSKKDAEEAYEVGREAVRAILDGEGGKSVVLQNDNIGGIIPTRVPLEEIAGKTRYVSEEYCEMGSIRGPKLEFIEDFCEVVNWEDQGAHYPRLKLESAV